MSDYAFESILSDLYAMFIMCSNIERLSSQHDKINVMYIKADLLASFNYYFDKFCKERGLIYV